MKLDVFPHIDTHMIDVNHNVAVVWLWAVGVGISRGAEGESLGQPSRKRDGSRNEGT